MQGKELSEHVPSEETYIGIDVCKSHLDIHIHPCDATWRVSNDRCGITAFLRRLAALPVVVRLVVVEATGKWHRAVHRRLHEAGYDVAVVNPYRSRKLADALGHLAKTDAIDARTLARFGQALRPRTTPPPPETVAALRELVAARRAAVAEAGALGNRLMTAEHGLVARQLRARIAMLKRHIQAMAISISDAIEADPAMANLFHILTSIPGVGSVAATTMIAELTELGACSRTQIAALLGVAPMNWDSGAMRGRRIIKGGRAPLRAVLYMAAIAAVRCNPEISAFYERLKDRGKKPKLALTAVMRKLVILANTLVRENRSWLLDAP
tara:strand:+ start:73 stop:1050 length:978 start_codon:yes stop_codon:yes gene_type:complete